MRVYQGTSMSSAKKTIKTITPDGTDSIARRARFRAVTAYVTYYVQRTCQASGPVG